MKQFQCLPTFASQGKNTCKILTFVQSKDNPEIDEEEHQISIS